MLGAPENNRRILRLFLNCKIMLICQINFYKDKKFWISITLDSSADPSEYKRNIKMKLYRKLNNIVNSKEITAIRDNRYSINFISDSLYVKHEDVSFNFRDASSVREFANPSFIVDVDNKKVKINKHNKLLRLKIDEVKFI